MERFPGAQIVGVRTPQQSDDAAAAEPPPEEE
jgi:hypothetical protein